MVKLKGRRESQDKTYDAVSEDDESKFGEKKPQTGLILKPTELPSEEYAKPRNAVTSISGKKKKIVFFL